MRNDACDPESDPVGRRMSIPREAVVYAVTLLLMLWPMAVNQGPFYTADSASYLHGGAFGIKTGLLAAQHWWQDLAGNAPVVATANDPRTMVAGAVAEAGGIRSPMYSVLTYLLRGPANSLVPLAIAQASAVAFIVSCLRRVIAPQLTLWPSIAIGVAVALLTSAPWYAAYAMPDILAGVAISAAVALTVFFDRLGTVLRATLVLLLALCITVHGSHLPLGFSVLAAGAVANFVLRRPGLSDAARRSLWFVSPILLAAAALLGTSYAAFGEASLAPKRYPIQLARSVADGPGAWYLRDHCATEHYAICEIFGPNPPREVREFLWSRSGVRYRATPEQMERIRAEEGTIVRRAAMEYPVQQLGRSASNIVLQLFHFGISDLVFGDRIVGTEDPSMIHASGDNPVLKAFWEPIIYLSFAASILSLLSLRHRLTGAEVAAVSVVVVGFLANAAVCGILSGVTDRYQGRVAWILPALAITIWLRVRAESRPEKKGPRVALGQA